MYIILALTFSIVVSFVFFLEAKRYKANYSPLFLVLIFNGAITLLYWFTSDWLGFYKLIFPTIVVLLYGCFIFACVSLIFMSVGLLKRKSYKKKIIHYVGNKPEKSIVVLAFLSILLMSHFIRSLGLDNIVDNQEAATELGGRGLSGHLMVLQIFLATHLIGRKITLTSSLAILGIIVCLFIYNVKAWVIIPLLIGWFIKRDIGHVKVNLYFAIIAPITLFSIFVCSYMISLGWDWGNMDFIWRHFTKYVFAGIGGLNVALTNNYPVGEASLYGMPGFIKFMFPECDFITPSVYDYVIINTINNEWTNVFSLFGQAYLFNGPFYGTLHLISLAIISYALYSLRVRTSNYWYYLAYYLWSSGLILSFFADYYKLLNIWELTAWALIVGFYHSPKKQIIQI